MELDHVLDELDDQQRRINALGRLTARRLHHGDLLGAKIAAAHMDKLEQTYAQQVRAMAQTTTDELLTPESDPKP